MPLRETLTYQIQGIVYDIKCLNCKAIYVGETSRKIHERFIEHRSSINTEKLSPVAKYFNVICPSLDILTITILKNVQTKIPNTLIGLLDRVDMIALQK